MDCKVIIYKIFNENQQYIGSTKNYNSRKSDHKCRKDCSSNIIIEKGNWDMKILEECNQENRYQREQYYIDNLENVVNTRNALWDRKKNHEKNKEKHNKQSRDYKINNMDSVKLYNKSRLDWKNSWCGDYRYTGNLLRIDVNLFC